MTTIVIRFKMTMVTKTSMTMSTRTKMTMVTRTKRTMVMRCSPIHLAEHTTAWPSDLCSSCFQRP